MTNRELLGLHAEVLSLRETLGISYKDAIHRLYMTEWEKLKTNDCTHKVFSTLTERTRDALTGFQVTLAELGSQDGKGVNANATLPTTASPSL